MSLLYGLFVASSLLYFLRPRLLLVVTCPFVWLSVVLLLWPAVWFIDVVLLLLVVVRRYFGWGPFGCSGGIVLSGCCFFFLVFFCFFFCALLYCLVGVGLVVCFFLVFVLFLCFDVQFFVVFWLCVYFFFCRFFICVFCFYFRILLAVFLVMLFLPFWFGFVGACWLMSCVW